jgi:hypothetical protein
MEPEGSLSRLQQPATCPYPEPDLPSLRLYQRISSGPRQMYPFRNKAIFTTSCQHLAKPPAGGPLPVGRPLLLIQYIRSYPPYWRLFIHPQTRNVIRKTKVQDSDMWEGRSTRGSEQKWVQNTGGETSRERPLRRLRRFGKVYGAILKKNGGWVEIRSIRLGMRNCD